MSGRGKVKASVVKIIKWTGLVLAALVTIFSIAPYLIALDGGTLSREELLFPNSEFIEINGIELHYRKWPGPGDQAKNILLVHGLAGSTFSWRYTAPVFQEEGFLVIAADLPGFGLSERKAGFDHSANARAELLWDMLEEMFPDQKWNLVGHSMGGAAVTAMALQRPDQTESVTLAAGALYSFEPSFYTELLRYPPAARWLSIYGSRLVADEQRIKELLASAYGQQPTELELSGYYQPLNIENTAAVWPDLLRTAPDPLVDRLNQLKMPVLCIWGEEDTWVPLEQGRKLNRLLPNSELVIMQGEGHCPMETAPDRFDRKLADFLSGLQDQAD